MKIVVLDGYAVARVGELSWRDLECFGEVVIYDHDEPENTVARLKGADIAITNKVIFDRNIMLQVPTLKLIAVAATGYNVVDCQAARDLGITVTNIPSYSTDSVAQMIFAMLLNITNRVQHYADENRKGRWSSSPDFCYADFVTHEIAGKTFGIVGMGNIGTKVASIAHSFGMKVIATTHRDQESLPSYVIKADIEKLLAEADVISLHCPLTPATEHVINADSIKKIKQGAILINTGRGPLIDEQAVADALHSGWLSAFAADVLSVEPPAADNPLLHAPNTYLTPHIAWASIEARQRLMQIMKDNIRCYIEGHPINVVN